MPQLGWWPAPGAGRVELGEIKSMGFFTSRERSELGTSAESRVQGREREVVRHDFLPRRRPASEPDLTGHVGTLMRRVADSSLQDIDELIAKLQRRREQLLAESERVQREIIEYAKLSQTTMQSTKIIAESLAHFNKVPDASFKKVADASFKKIADAPRLSELHLANDDNGERRNGRPDSFGDDIERRNGRPDSFGDDGERRNGRAEAFGDNGERRNGRAESLDDEEARLKGLAEALAQHDENHDTQPDEDHGASEGNSDDTEAPDRARPETA
jgi:hypothetical protein